MRRRHAEPLPQPPHFTAALPAYLGGKRTLAPLIFSLIADVLPRERWGGTTFLDPFSGGGAVALTAKAHGFSVIATDIAERAAVVGGALLSNNAIQLVPADVGDLLCEPDPGYPRVAEAQVPSVFNARQAEFLDRAFARANRRAEPKRSLLRLLLIKLTLRCQPMSMLRGTDARAAATGDFDRVSPRRLGHYLRSDRQFTPDGLWGLAQEVNGGVFGGRALAVRSDAVASISSHRADLLYLDPPYPGTTSYAREYAVLDALLGDDPSRAPAPSLDDLLEAAREVPLVVLSFGGPTVSLETLIQQVRRHRPVKTAHAIPYRHLGSIASEEKNRANREFVVVACR